MRREAASRLGFASQKLRASLGAGCQIEPQLGSARMVGYQTPPHERGSREVVGTPVHTPSRIARCLTRPHRSEELVDGNRRVHGTVGVLTRRVQAFHRPGCGYGVKPIGHFEQQPGGGSGVVAGLGGCRQEPRNGPMNQTITHQAPAFYVGGERDVGLAIAPGPCLGER